MEDPSDLSSTLARILQSLRTERGWSLDQLAHRSGVSKGVLVSLEQQRSNPNLATLARIADSFGVPVTRLLDVPDEPVVRITGPDRARELWHGQDGGTGTIIAATEPPWAVELWRWTVQPGERFGGDAHAPASKEMIWVESGTMTLTVAGRGYQVGAGQCARFPVRPAALLRQRRRRPGADDDDLRDPPGPGLARGTTPGSTLQLLQAGQCLLQHLGPLAEREADLHAPGVGVVVEHRVGDRDDAGRCGQVRGRTPRRRRRRDGLMSVVTK